MLNGLYQEILNLTLSSLAILPAPDVLDIMYIGNVKCIVSRNFFTGLFHTLPAPIVLGILCMW
jgi:hypothetical protein